MDATKLVLPSLLVGLMILSGLPTATAEPPRTTDSVPSESRSGRGAVESKSSLVDAVLPLGARAASARPGGKQLTVGKPAPNFRIRALDGAMVRLDERAYAGREKGYAPKHPVLLDFFRTDCEPCIRALPQLVTLHESHHRQGLEVIMVALLEEDAGDRKLAQFLARHELPFVVVKDIHGHVAEKYMGKVVSLPATFLIDRTGILRKTKFSGRGNLETHLGTELSAVLTEHAKARRR